MPTRRKTFEDLGVDRNALIAEATGSAIDQRTCYHGKNPELGCGSCWVFGWLFDDRRNPAHPYHKRDRHLSFIMGSFAPGDARTHEQGLKKGQIP
jgi:hypothetical protein